MKLNHVTPGINLVINPSDLALKKYLAEHGYVQQCIICAPASLPKELVAELSEFVRFSDYGDNTQVTRDMRLCESKIYRPGEASQEVYQVEYHPDYIIDSPQEYCQSLLKDLKNRKALIDAELTRLAALPKPAAPTESIECLNCDAGYQNHAIWQYLANHPSLSPHIDGIKTHLKTIGVAGDYAKARTDDKADSSDDADAAELIKYRAFIREFEDLYYEYDDGEINSTDYLQELFMALSRLEIIYITVTL